MTWVTNTCSMAMGVWDILREGLKIPLRNRKLMLSIALSLLIPSSLILLASHFALTLVTKDLLLKEYLLHGKDPRSSEYPKLLAGVLQDIQVLVSEETIFILATYVLSVFLTVAMIYASAMSYSSKESSHKELILMVGRSWKRPMITSLYVALFGIGYATLLVGLIALLVVTAKGPIIFIVFGAVIALLLLFVCIYLGAIWKLGIVVSVVEERYGGMKALGRAEELIKGRKLQGFILNLLLSLFYWVITGIFLSKSVDIKLAKATRLAISLVFLDVVCLLQLFMYMVFTVFYFQCKKSHGEEGETRVEIGYHLVSTTTEVDASIP